MHRIFYLAVLGSLLTLGTAQVACTNFRTPLAHSGGSVVWPVDRGGGEVHATWQPAVRHITLLEQKIAERLVEERRPPITRYVFRYFGVEDETGVYVMCFGELKESVHVGFQKVPEPGDSENEIIPLGPHAITAKYDVGKDRLIEFKPGPIL